MSARRRLAVLFLGISLAVAPGARRAEAQVIKLGTIAPEGTPWLDAIRAMADDWKAATGGKIEFKIYPGGVVGGEPQQPAVRRQRGGGHRYAPTRTCSSVRGARAESRGSGSLLRGRTSGP